MWKDGCLKVTKITNALARQIHLKWWSKAKSNWIGEGEKNTKFFHNLVKMKRRRSRVEEIVVEGKVIKDNNEMAGSFANWYEELWTFFEERRTNKVDLNNFEWVRISTEDCATLEREFSEEEIWVAVNSLRRGKSPGPDGFILEFYIQCWEEMKKQ
ncbi:hypothetical protein Cni_G10393 [Canna indica]|uniref:Reverse transcriptase n=1 Tax=Canna indica TaxID=4628 RepID=A0AAQ3K9T8_9LILI|nr:hypothetical protein Cni_G10393 [Canna indica]